MMSQRSLLVALLCAAWILPGLFGHDPWKPDEAHTFGVVYELLRGGSWVVPALAGELFLEKPPLFYLTAAVFAKLFSFALPLHDAARLATGAWIATIFGFTAAAGREFYGVRYGAVSALLLLGCFGFVVRGHQLITDVALLAGFAMAYYGFALVLRRAGLGGFWILFYSYWLRDKGSGMAARVGRITGPLSGKAEAVSCDGSLPEADAANAALWSRWRRFLAGDVLIGSSVTYGSAGLKLETREGRPAFSEAWKNPKLTCYISTPVPVGRDHVYLVTGTIIPPPSATLRCVDAKSGKELWSKPGIGKQFIPK